ncbi:SDR family oxidoreductase [Lacibacter sp. H375]|uniref:SDR family oxidoreductase n=1 Tax=Lacibacter sp. H375 TaxID=3133424 RepID=UPI0030BCD0E9
MNLELENQLFIVGGATSGFGKAVAHKLLEEGAVVIAVARNREQLHELYDVHRNAEVVVGDITQSFTIEQLKQQVADRTLHGMLVNAGGPPAKTVLETTLDDWDDAYAKILRWKVEITQAFVPTMSKAGYGRIVYIESSSVKQPIENLVLSTSLRLAVVGMVKTLSQEIAKSGVTLNILGPGSHNTPAIDRLYHKKSEQTGVAFDEVKKAAIQQIPVGRLGEADDFASLAVWLLSKQSGYVTGQTIMIDGGAVRSTL